MRHLGAIPVSLKVARHYLCDIRLVLDYKNLPGFDCYLLHC